MQISVVTCHCKYRLKTRQQCYGSASIIMLIRIRILVPTFLHLDPDPDEGAGSGRDPKTQVNEVIFKSSIRTTVLVTKLFWCTEIFIRWIRYNEINVQSRWCFCSLIHWYFYTVYIIFLNPQAQAGYGSGRIRNTVHTGPQSKGQRPKVHLS